MSVIPVSICIPVKNEEKNLPMCLAELTNFDDIVVIDSGSTDQTVLIAQERGATVLQFEWNGKFPKKRNWALRNYKFKYPWILFLDADEIMNSTFVEELKRVLPTTSHVGFWISFTNWFMGTPLHHGDTFHKLSLIKYGAGEYEHFPDNLWSDLDMEVHEHPILHGTVGNLKSRLTHHDYSGLKKFINRHNEYSSWEANRFMWLQDASESAWSVLNERQKFKYHHLDKWWFAWFYWTVSVWLKRGFLDGKNGMYFGLLKKRYFEEIRLKIIDAKRTGICA